MILGVALLGGEILLRMFGISMPAFQAAGGLLILLMGLEMLRGSPTKVQNESTHEDDSEDRILIPLAMPLIAGRRALPAESPLQASTHEAVRQRRRIHP